ncbi:hypothetical protein B0H10DRAFT_2229899 [Mycena sp. CBHHK59/15]|nr:hypothetical protein B0H10DRAFT_2229899 [Mycena sp. CBHHK59/15]
MQGTFVYNWGLPGINIDPPPFARATPLGLYDLRRHLGVLKCQPGIFNQNKPHFLASDIAWFAGGASTNGRYLTDRFFPEFNDLHQMLPVRAVGGEARKSLNLKMQHVVFDLATLWDRSFGGSTIVLHMEGTTVPNTPVLPEYLRCTAYLPPLFLSDNPASHGPIAQIAQTFIKSVGVPTVNKWFSNARARGWPLSQSGPHPNPTSSTLIPAPNGADSVHYKFLGRPIGALNEILGTRPSPPPLFVIPDDDMEDLLERLGDAEGRINEHLTQIQALEEQAEMLISQVVALETALAAERQSNTTLRNALNAPTRSTPATLSRSQPAPGSARTPATPRSPSTPTRRHPPPYSPSGVPPRLTPFAPSPSRFAPDHTDLNAFLTSHGLDNQVDAINMLLRIAHPVKWAEELTQLGVPDDLVPLVLDVMSMQ